jgi:hypothetical protein
MVRLYRDSELRSLLARKASEEYLPIRWELMKQRYLTLMNDLVSTTGRRTAATRAKVTA